MNRTTAAVGAAAVVAALAAAPQRPAATASRPASLAGVTFQRRISPFPVMDASGHAHALPFLGGLDVPRPQFVDIDGDGDLDLFLQEYSNALWFFENTGTAKAPRYAWRTDKYQGLDIGEWYRFVDIDADGLVDLVAELPFSHIRYYRNTGTTTEARFASADTLRDVDGEPMFLDRQNIPAFVDVDCDGRLDLFIGRVEGTVARYEAERPGSPRFAFITEQWEGIEIIGRVGGPRPTMHGANALAFADYDGDGDPDLYWGDFFEPGVLLIENIGRTCSTPSFQVDPFVLPADGIKTSGYNAPAPVDLDADGDMDFAMGVLGGAFNPVGTASDNFYYWERTAPTALTLRTKRFLDDVDVGSESAPALADIDGDGDLDLLVGNKIDPVKGDAGQLLVYRNDGTPTAPRFVLTNTLEFGGAYHLAPALADLDGDGDLDMLIGTWNQDVLFVRNTGTAKAPTWTLDPAATIKPPRVTNAMPALADIDGDGDLDLFLGQGNGAIVFYRNEGTPKAPKFVLVSDKLDGINVGRRSAPALVDVDGDGLLDLVVGREMPGLAVYRNAGTRTAPHFVEAPELDLPLPQLATPVFADVDGDGVPDVVAGTTSGGLVFYQGRR